MANKLNKVKFCSSRYSSRHDGTLCFAYVSVQHDRRLK
jgi:hypothetical protein